VLQTGKLTFIQTAVERSPRSENIHTASESRIDRLEIQDLALHDICSVALRIKKTSKSVEEARRTLRSVQHILAEFLSIRNTVDFVVRDHRR
jgi:hypothetical protein